MKKIMTLLFVCLMGIGCTTQVDLCDFPVHPHRYELHVTYDWGDQQNTPDSMYIIGNRLYNTIRYWFSYDIPAEKGKLLRFLPNKPEEQQQMPSLPEPEVKPEPEPDPVPDPEPDPTPLPDPVVPEEDVKNILQKDNQVADGNEGEGTTPETGEGETPDSGTTPEGGDTPGENVPDDGGQTPEEDKGDENEEEKLPVLSDFSVRAGYYQLMTINDNKELLIDSLEQYMSNIKVSTKKLKLGYKKYTKPHFKGDTLRHWVDFNKGYPYIDNIGTIYYDLAKMDTESQDGMYVTFHPQPITQQINFHLNIQLMGKEVTVDSIRGEVSGVCPKMELLSRYLTMDATQSCRIIFDAKVDKMEADSLVTVHSTIHVPSLMNSADPKMKTGPGMLYLAVYVHAIDDSGKAVRKTCFAGANLYPYLIANPLTMLTDDIYLHHVITKPVVDIQIDKILPISRDEILDVKDPEQNMEYWFKEEGDQGGSDIEF